jgi:DNA-directed RNA polymerase specialized sigma subunit
VDGARLRSEYLEAVDRYEEAASAMRAAMDEADETLDFMRSHVAAGRQLAGALPSIGPAGIRTNLSEAAEQLEKARHAAQRLVYEILIDEGLSMAEIGRMLGVSRSLVSRVVHERS